MVRENENDSNGRGVLIYEESKTYPFTHADKEYSFTYTSEEGWQQTMTPEEQQYQADAKKQLQKKLHRSGFLNDMYYNDTITIEDIGVHWSRQPEDNPQATIVVARVQFLMTGSRSKVDFAAMAPVSYKVETRADVVGVGVAYRNPIDKHNEWRGLRLAQSRALDDVLIRLQWRLGGK